MPKFLIARAQLIVMLLLVIACLTQGCGDSEDQVFTSSQSGSAVTTGTILVQATLQRAIPSQVTRMVYSGLDAQGRIVYGPLSLAKTAEMRLENIPTAVTRLQYVLLAGDQVLGFGADAVRVTAGQVTPVVDPPFDDLTAPVERLDLSPTNAVSPLGSSLQYSAIATLASGEQQDVTTLVSYTSLTPAVASVSNTEGSRGLATGSAVGTTQIQAALSTSVGTITGTTSLQVVDAVPVELTVTTQDGGPAVVSQGLPLQLEAQVRYSNGLVVDETTQAQWSSLDPTVFGVGASTGLVTGLAPGSGTVSVGFSGLSAQLPITVTNVALVGLEINFAEFLLAPRGSQALRAFGVYEDQSRRELTNAVTWSTSAASVAAVTPGGLVLAQGTTGQTATITATLDNLSASSLASIRQDLYMTDTTSGIVQQRLNNDESLVAMGQTKFVNGTDYQELEFHPSGAYLFAFTDDGRVQAFSIAPADGALTLESTATSTIVSSAFADRVSLKSHPSGALLYLCAQGSQLIEGFAFDAQSGELSALGQVATATTPLFGLAIEPQGQFLYALRPAGTEVLGFAIDETSGDLSPLGATPLPLTIDDATCIATAKRESPILYLAGDTLMDGFRIGADGSLSAAPIIPLGNTDQADPNRLVIRGTGSGFSLVSISEPIWRLVSLIGGTITSTGGAASFQVTSFGLAYSSSTRTHYRQTAVTGLVEAIPPGFELAPFSVPGPTARSLVATP